MEERKLRVHLIRIYIVTLACILGVMLAVVLLLSLREIELKSRESFSTLLTAIADDLQVNNVVRHSELRQLEQENSLLIPHARQRKNAALQQSGQAPRRQTCWRKPNSSRAKRAMIR